jgi:hypothetical protein
MMAADWRWRAARGVIVVLALLAGACGDDGEDDTGQEDEAANTTVAAANTTTSAAANTTASAETDEKLNACMDQHEMSQAETVWRMRDGITTYYKRCAWPRVEAADPDGYTEIKVIARRGPGDSEASGTTNADVIKSMCSELEVEYSNVYGGGGEVDKVEEPRPAIRSEPARVIVYTGEEWPTDSQDSDQLPFDYQPDELVVLRDSRVVLDDVRCGT